MGKYKPEEWDAEYAADFLHGKGLEYLRVRKRGDLLIVESGPADDPIKHARLRRDTVHLWILEIADHKGRWEFTGLRDQRDKLLAALITEFPWILTPTA